jgi:hypothetical protein
MLTESLAAAETSTLSLTCEAYKVSLICAAPVRATNKRKLTKSIFMPDDAVVRYGEIDSSEKKYAANVPEDASLQWAMGNNEQWAIVNRTNYDDPLYLQPGT